MGIKSSNRVRVRTTLSFSRRRSYSSSNFIGRHLKQANRSLRFWGCILPAANRRNNAAAPGASRARLIIIYGRTLRLLLFDYCTNDRTATLLLKLRARNYARRDREPRTIPFSGSVSRRRATQLWWRRRRPRVDVVSLARSTIRLEKSPPATITGWQRAFVVYVNGNASLRLAAASSEFNQ